jgi:hypothetical protein
MEQVGTDFNVTGSVMNRDELEEIRKKRGECVTCGQKCFRKKLFKMIPIDDHGKVLNGRCLNCNPLSADDAAKESGGVQATSRPATREDLARFTRSQSNLHIGGPGVVPRRGVMASHSGSEVLSSGPSLLQRGVVAPARSMPPRNPGPSSRTMGNRSLSMMVPSTMSSQEIPNRSSSLVQPSSHASLDGTESQALPSPPPQTEPSPYSQRSPSAPPRTVSGGSALSTGSGHHSIDATGSLPLVPSERGGQQTRLRRAGSRRRITAHNSGQSLRSVDSSIMEVSNSDLDALENDEEMPEPKPSSLGDLPRGSNTSLGPPPTNNYGGLHDHYYEPDVSSDQRESHDEVQKQIHEYTAQDILQRHPSDRPYEPAHHIEYQQNLMGHAGSNRSLRSASSLGDRSHHSDLDEFDGPRHGVLDRGGQFEFKTSLLNGGGSSRQMGSHIVSGSSRTLSSMSSIEEDQLHRNGSIGRQMSRKRLSLIVPANAVESLYEQSDEGIASVHSRASAAPSHASSRNTTSTNRKAALEAEKLSEQRFVERIRRAGHELDFREILLILREAIASPVVVKEAFEEFSCLELNADDHDVLTDLDAPHLIADAMQAHTRLLEAQLWGCGAIWNTTGTVRSQLAFVDAGALDLILAAMENFLDSVDVQEKAIATLSNLGAAEDNLAILIDKGAVGRIVEAMNKHSEVSSVQIKGCSAMTNFASHVSPLKRRIMDLGGGGAVVICMVMHPEDFYLQEKALRALRNLCANSEENKVGLANIGGIDAVISAMQVHRDEAGVQEEGAWTLSNLAGNDDNKAVIGDCGGIDVIIRAMWVHSDNVGVEEWCCRALFTLTLDAHNGTIVLDVGGISAVVNAMQAHVDSPAVQEMGCAVLGNLAGNDASKMRIVDEEALDAIVLAMVLFGDDAQLQERACIVLIRLAIPENHKSMHAANIGELVRVAAEKFPDKCEEPARRLLHILEG